LFCGLDAGEYSYGRCANFISHLKEFFMTERMVDVMDKTGKVLHTYPISLSASSPRSAQQCPGPRDTDYEKAALSAARTAKLVPESDFASLKTRVHQAAAKAAA
jgi:hypothetical protein